MKTQPRFPVRSAESRFSATETIQENIALVPVLRKEGIEIYKVSLAVLRNFLKSGLLTQSEYVQCEQTLAEKCGLSLGSIFRESA